MMAAGYDVMRLAWLLSDLPVELSGRLRSDRVSGCPAHGGQATDPQRALRALQRRVKRLVGSNFYARAADAEGDRIVGVFQMDMIAGPQRGSTPKVEIHAESSVPGPVVRASDALGDLVARTVPAFDPAVTVQHLTGRGDPALGRSDHASFHERGMGGRRRVRGPLGTRQYHTPGDTLLDQDHDTDFAATIAGSGTATALTFAGL